MPVARFAMIGLAAMAAGCSSTPEEDPVQVKLNDLDTRLTRLERTVQNQNLVQVANQLEALRADVRNMHNDVDQLNNNAEQARKQQRDLYADLDARMKALEARGGAAPAADGVPASAGGADDKSAYQAAFNLMKDGQYDKAITAFQSFMSTHANSSLADNAQYWLGEAYYVNRSYPEAQVAFQRVVEKYPDSRKVPDALLKIGFCRYESKQYEPARSILSQVVRQYPDSPAAKLAQQRLDKMKTENH